MRVALGAERGLIVWLVVRQGMRWPLSAIIVRSLGGHASGRIMSGLLCGVTPTDLPAFAVVPTLVASVALAAALLPARRAAAGDPIEAPRGESRQSSLRSPIGRLRTPQPVAPDRDPTA